MHRYTLLFTISLKLLNRLFSPKFYRLEKDKKIICQAYMFGCSVDTWSRDAFSRWAAINNYCLENLLIVSEQRFRLKSFLTVSLFFLVEFGSTNGRLIFSLSLTLAFSFQEVGKRLIFFSNRSYVVILVTIGYFFPISIIAFSYCGIIR